MECLSCRDLGGQKWRSICNFEFCDNNNDNNGPSGGQRGGEKSVSYIAGGALQG